MAILTFPKGSTQKVSEHFHAYEFDCPCTNSKCGLTLIDENLIAGVERIRAKLGVPVVITSGFRCDWYQTDLARRGYETAKNSTHRLGKAVDIRAGQKTGLQLEAAARSAGFEAVGVGRFFIHIDLRAGKIRSWSYKY